MKNPLSTQLYHHLAKGLPLPAEQKGPGWWWPIQAQAQKSFLAQGLPSTKSEAYRYTSLETKLAPSFADGIALVGPPVLGVVPQLKQFPGYHIVLHNGVLQPLPPLPVGLTVTPFSQATASQATLLENHLSRLAQVSEDPFVALNTAQGFHGLLVAVAEGEKIDQPVYLHDFTTTESPAASYPRFFFHLGKGSQATLLQIPYAPSRVPSLVNTVTEILLAPQSVLQHSHLQLMPMPAAHLFNHTQVTLGAASRLHAYTATLSGRLVRNHFGCLLAGEGSEANLFGNYVGQGNNHTAHHIAMVHKAIHTTGHTFYKGIASGCSSHLFHGKINVKPQAQHTDASQYHHGWLVGRRAQICARPELAIAADEVSCRHGVTIAQAAEEALFYLRARGLPNVQAHQMLREAFLQETFTKMGPTFVNDFIKAHVCQVCSSLPCS